MVKLALLRHAKSSWEDSFLNDFARPLADRGLKAAPLMGAYIAAERLRPDFILCSTARRTRETLALVLPHLGPPPPTVVFEDGLYLASVTDLMARLHKIAPQRRTVLMIGHNPGFHDLALALVGEADPAFHAVLAVNFPTAALAVFDFKTTDWSTIKPQTGHLTHFATPSYLKRSFFGMTN